MKLKEISEQIGCSLGTVRKWTIHLGVFDQPTFYLNHDFFRVQTVKNSYWAGVLAADGNIRMRGGRYCISLSVKETDSELIYAFAKSINWKGKVTHRNRKRKETTTRCCEIEISSKQMANDLVKNFNLCTENKSFHLNPPCNLSKECELAYIHGLIDGDGCIKFTRKYWRLTFKLVGTNEICEYVKVKANELLSIHQLAVSPKCKSIHKSWSSLQLNCRKALLFLEDVKPYHDFYMSRKWDHIKVYKKYKGLICKR